MEDKKIIKTEEKSADFARVFGALLHRAWAIGFLSVASAVLVILGTFFFVTPQYQSSAMFYVNNSNFSIGNASVSISSGDLTTSRNLVDSYIVILDTLETLDDVMEYAGVCYSYSQFKDMIHAAAVNETELFRITVTSPDPQEAERIAGAIAHILPQRIGTIIDGTSARVAEAAVIPSSPSSPNYTVNGLVGFLLGLVISVGVLALRVILDSTITTTEDVAQCCKHPILVSVPDMSAPSKGSYSYYSKKRYGKYNTAKSNGQFTLIGPDISFAASEAYKLLRTKLQFAFADEKNCRVIGLSSALSGEGKSLTSVNLAFHLSQLNNKVLLIDCDLRRPTLAEKLGIDKQPGLSSYLTHQSDLGSLLRPCGIPGHENDFYVITAGQTPPNPIELLSSPMMELALDDLRAAFDYVILDLPPVGEVSDAMAIAKQTDGMLLVVRQNYCDRNVLSSTVQQFDFIESRILGIVFNCTNEHTGKYGRGYYKRYYRRYGKNYAGYSHYAAGARTASDKKNKKQE